MARVRHLSATPSATRPTTNRVLRAGQPRKERAPTTLSALTARKDSQAKVLMNLPTPSTPRRGTQGRVLRHLPIRPTTVPPHHASSGGTTRTTGGSPTSTRQTSSSMAPCFTVSNSGSCSQKPSYLETNKELVRSGRPHTQTSADSWVDLFGPTTRKSGAACAKRFFCKVCGQSSHSMTFCGTTSFALTTRDSSKPAQPTRSGASATMPEKHLKCILKTGEAPTCWGRPSCKFDRSYIVTSMTPTLLTLVSTKLQTPQPLATSTNGTGITLARPAEARGTALKSPKACSSTSYQTKTRARADSMCRPHKVCTWK